MRGQCSTCVIRLLQSASIWRAAPCPSAQRPTGQAVPLPLATPVPGAAPEPVNPLCVLRWRQASERPSSESDGGLPDVSAAQLVRAPPSRPRQGGTSKIQREIIAKSLL